MLCDVLLGALIPLAGTSFGALVAFVSLGKLNEKVVAILSGFAGGVMVAASVWSLILPAVDYSDNLGRLSFLVPCVGIIAGVAMMLLSDSFFKSKSPSDNHQKENLLYFAVTLHNVPEGMAIGAAYAAYVLTKDKAAAVSALLLSVGIAIQNIPEGAIVSLPHSEKEKSKLRAFFKGVMSGIVEPIAVIMTVILSELIVPVLPFMLTFAAGAMLYVVLKELIPDFSKENCFTRGITAFFSGFLLMMSLDIALG